VHEKIEIKLHLYSHSFEYEVHKLFSPVPATLPSSSQSSASASSASVNFSSAASVPRDTTELIPIFPIFRHDQPLRWLSK
jgi:hypothetical protein